MSDLSLDADDLRAAAAALGFSPEGAFDRLAAPLGDRIEAYETLPEATRTEEPLPRDVTVDPDLSTDEFNAYTSSFTLSGADDGPLAGWTLAVKDNIAVAGVPLTAGSAAFKAATPGRHAPVVSRLLDAGATLGGKTNMDELAYGPTGETGAFGPTRNPIQPAHVAGGSSAGSGAAVAAGAVDAALGTDTGGSVRIPAAFCGVVGYKPSFGVVPRTGVVPLAPSLEGVGVLAATVTDAARVADVIAGGDPLDPATAGRTAGDLTSGTADAPPAESCSFGLVEEFLGTHVDVGVRGRVERAVEDVEATGATVEHVSTPRFDLTAPAWDVVANVEFAAALFAGCAPLGGSGVDADWHAEAGMEARASDAFGDRVVENALIGAALLRKEGASPYHRALAECERFAADVRRALGDHDALLAPTTPVTAPAVGAWPLSAAERAADEADRPPLSVNVRGANLLGAPALSLPCGRVDGLPVGLQLLGAPGDDAALLGAARAVERAVGDAPG